MYVLDCQCTTNTVGKIPNPPDDTDHGTSELFWSNTVFKCILVDFIRFDSNQYMCHYLDRTFLLYNDQQTYEINCCGYISQWETNARYTGDLYAQIWRSVGGNWSFIGENNLTISGKYIYWYQLHKIRKHSSNIHSVNKIIIKKILYFIIMMIVMIV